MSAVVAMPAARILKPAARWSAPLRHRQMAVTHGSNGRLDTSVIERDPHRTGAN